jgi:hypothetical protein
MALTFLAVAPKNAPHAAERPLRPTTTRSAPYSHARLGPLVKAPPGGRRRAAPQSWAGSSRHGVEVRAM